MNHDTYSFCTYMQAPGILKHVQQSKNPKIGNQLKRSRLFTLFTVVSIFITHKHFATAHLWVETEPRVPNSLVNVENPFLRLSFQ